MMTFRQFASKPETIPATTFWYLADLGEARGKQDLFTKQSPQKLKEPWQGAKRRVAKNGQMGIGNTY
jgi:hypothetical protein